MMSCGELLMDGEANIAENFKLKLTRNCLPRKNVTVDSVILTHELTKVR